MNELITSCKINRRRLEPLKECMQLAGPDESIDEWQHSIIHPETIAYDCGHLCLPGNTVKHHHDPSEISLCKQLAKSAKRIIGQTEVGCSESFSRFKQFYIVANQGNHVPINLTKEYLRQAFNGVIYPEAEIVIQPFKRGNACWEEFVAESSLEIALRNLEGYDKIIEKVKKEHEKCLRTWNSLHQWIKAQDTLLDASFVMIGTDKPPSETNYACAFPRLFLGMTQQGSLVGICSHAVHT